MFICKTNACSPTTTLLGKSHGLHHCWRSYFALQWRHNERDGVSNHQRLDSLFNRLFGRRLKKTPKLRVTGLREGKPPVTGGSPHKGSITRKMFPFDDVIMEHWKSRVIMVPNLSSLGTECHYERHHDKSRFLTEDTNNIKFQNHDKTTHKVLILNRSWYQVGRWPSATTMAMRLPVMSLRLYHRFTTTMHWSSVVFLLFLLLFLLLCYHIIRAEFCRFSPVDEE